MSFAPKQEGIAYAKLTIVNPLSNEIFEYELQGTGEEPLSEGHI